MGKSSFVFCHLWYSFFLSLSLSFVLLQLLYIFPPRLPILMQCAPNTDPRWELYRNAKKNKKNKQKKKQGNKHFPPHSSCSYVMCPEYCLLVFYLFLHSDFVLVVTESIFTFRCESEEEAGSWRDVGDRGDNFFHPTKSSVHFSTRAAIFKDKRSV